MDSRIVNKELNFIIRPILKQNGFNNFSNRTYWRYHSNRIDIINFQSFNSYNSKILGCTTFSFSVNLSVYLTFVPEQTKIKEKSGKKRPDESQGHFRCKLKKGINQRKFLREDIWSIDDEGKNITTVVLDCKNQIEQVGFDWFNRFDTKEKIFNILTKNEIDMNKTWGFGNFDSALRNELTAYVALELGRIELAIEKLNKLIDFYREQSTKLEKKYYLQQIYTIKQEIDRIKTFYNKQKKRKTYENKKK